MNINWKTIRIILREHKLDDIHTFIYDIETKGMYTEDEAFTIL